MILGFNFYSFLSGQVINWDKLHICFGSSISTARQVSLIQILGIKKWCFPFIYLGVPLFKGALTVSHFSVYS